MDTTTATTITMTQTPTNTFVLLPFVVIIAAIITIVLTTTANVSLTHDASGLLRLLMLWVDAQMDSYTERERCLVLSRPRFARCLRSFARSLVRSFVRSFVRSRSHHWCWWCCWSLSLRWGTSCGCRWLCVLVVVEAVVTPTTREGRKFSTSHPLSSDRPRCAPATFISFFCPECSQ